MSKKWLVRFYGLIFTCFLVATNASAYYYYVLYNTSTGPFNQPIFYKFDLNALVNNTVPFFIQDTGPAVLAPGDSFEAMIGEIRGAASIWNNVSTSKIRLGYGGLFTVGSASENSPGIDVEFSDEIPPGLIALGGPVVTGNMGYGDNGLIVPIVRSRIYLPNDMTQVTSYGNFPSYSEAFFVTLVHEFGHTLGLQHTLTSSVMSTIYTSGASKASPLGADDIAGISMLYPADGYLKTVGSITGQVTLNGSGLGLASVVALSASNPAISTLTNPDGSYRMDGVPPGEYFVYVHPLPPPLDGESHPDNIVLPTDVNGNSLDLNYTAFATEFYTGHYGGSQMVPPSGINVNAGKVTSNINFAVTARPYEAVYAVRTYGFSSTEVPVTAPPIIGSLSTPATIEATGAGLFQTNTATSNVITPGLDIVVLGNALVTSNLRPYPPPTPYIALDVQPNLAAGPGPKHLLFYTPSDLYILPAAFWVVNNPPPSIISITPALDSKENRVVWVAGTGFFPDQYTNTTILFDGLPGVIESVSKEGNLVVAPPPGPSKYTATVEALNSDGQSSLFLDATPATFTYNNRGVPSLAVTPATLVQGAQTTVDIVGVRTNFISGVTTVGFGTSDVVVNQVNVISPNHLSVVVTPNVTVPTSGINVTTGLEVISEALGNQIN